MYEPGCDVVVVSYRTPADLADFLASLEAHPPTGPWSVQVVNVDPRQEDNDVAEQWCARHPDRARHFTFGTNVGYAVACNAAAARGNHEVLAFFNADVVLTAGAIDACHQALLANPARGVVGPRQVDELGRITHAGIFGTLAAPRHRGWMEQTDAYTDVRDDAVTVSGAAYFVRRSLWDELSACPIYQAVAPEAEGAFLPTAFAWEETWASYHAHAHGWLVCFLGTATVLHRWNRSVKTNGLPAGVLAESQAYFRRACASHGLDHD